MIRTFCGGKSSKNTIEPHQNVTGTGNFTKKANKLWQKQSEQHNMKFIN